MRPFACGEPATIEPMPSSTRARPTWLNDPDEPRLVFAARARVRRGKRAVAVPVDGARDPLGFDRVAQDRQVAGSILVLAEDGGRDRPCRVVDRPDQGQPRPATFEPVVAAPVELEEESLGAHPRPSAAVLRWPPVAWAGDALGTQDVADALPADDDRLALREELAEVAVVDLAVRLPP